MIKVGIIGGAGYTAGELIRILIHHPESELTFVHSESHSGEKLSNVHRDLEGDSDLLFTNSIDKVDVVFLCAGHGKSKEILATHNLKNLNIIDLSADYRLDDSFSYGLPELNEQYKNKIANPGCFATAIQLALLPLSEKQLLKNEVHVHAITGSTGAGQSLSPTTHFSWRTGNVSIYKAFEHQHLNEIHKTLESKQNDKISINFIPVRGPFTRGIFASAYTDCDLKIEQLDDLYNSYYDGATFTNVSATSIDLKQVVNTNKCLIHLEKHGSKVLITSAIDNLLKGASGQAVQNMNIMFGMDQKTGLQLKSNYF